VNNLFLQIPAEEQTLVPGELVIKAGAVPGKLVLLLEGQVEVLTLMHERVLLEAPTVLGEISLLSQSPATADVRALTALRVRYVTHDAWHDWGVAHPEALTTAYAELSRLAIQRLAGRFHERYVALVAHDGRKGELIEFVRTHREFFASRSIIATDNTGKLIEQESGLMVARRVLSGPMGGDQEIGALVSRGFVEAVFFYRDPLWAQPHQADVSALIRICEVANVPLATNNATAELLVRSLA
jgi:methylglyoxal synthase